MKNYQTVVMSLIVNGNFPSVTYPEINDRLGNSQNEKEFYITKQNQNEYLAEYSSDEIIVLDEEFQENFIAINIVPHGNMSCEVLDASIYVDDLGIGRMTMIVELPLSPTYESVKLDSVVYLDELDGNVYTCEVVELDIELVD